LEPVLDRASQGLVASSCNLAELCRIGSASSRISAASGGDGSTAIPDVGDIPLRAPRRAGLPRSPGAGAPSSISAARRRTQSVARTGESPLLVQLPPLHQRPDLHPRSEPPRPVL